MVGMSTGALEAAFGFTAADLPENRVGRLSAAQLSRMTTTRGQAQVANLVFGAIFVVILIIIAIVVLPGALAPQPANSSAVPPGIIVLVIAVVAVIIALSLLRTRSKTKRLTGTVLSTEGPAKTRARSVGNVDQLGTSDIYRLTVGSVTFPLSSQGQLAAFEEGRTYRCYYVKGTLPIIVSAEAV